MKKITAFLFMMAFGVTSHAECHLANTPDDPFVAAKSYQYKVIAGDEIDVPLNETGPGKANWYRFLGSLYGFMRANPTLRVDVLGNGETKSRIDDSMQRFAINHGDKYEWRAFGAAQGTAWDYEKIRYAYTTETGSRKVRFVFHP